MKIITKIFILVSILSLSACVTSGSKKIQAIKKDNKVLIVSSMGNDYELLHIGFTIFSNDSNTLNVEDWNIDSIVESKVANIKVIEKINFVNVNLSSLKNNMTKLSKDYWTDGVAFKGFDDEVFPFARNENYDLILFISGYSSEDPVFFTGMNLDGYGLYKRKIHGKPYAKYYAMVSTSLYDVETRKKIAGSSSSKSAFTEKYNMTKGVETIDHETISKDKDIIISLIMNSIYSQFEVLGMLKTN